MRRQQFCSVPAANFGSCSAFASAIHLVRQHKNLRSLDSLHLGYALGMKCTKFVTFDQRQARVAIAEKLLLWPRRAPFQI